MLEFGRKVKARESQVNNCLEVQMVTVDGETMVELTDSKNKVEGARLLLTMDEWNAHLEGVRNGDTFDVPEPPISA